MAKPRISSAEYREQYLKAKEARGASSPGQSSSPSTEKPQESGHVLEQGAPLPAPTTEQSSTVAPKVVSTAGSAAGSPSDKLPVKKTASKKK